ncbi:HPr(Ser) kinase/phosphatase [Desulfurispira natronophila]|uniref:HPr kinase/phosphorylase n=1 Tax=Desulfurispira natronophila TaxID=682562 RepID=A0A7W8DHT1_9BACT|nr:HPr kinase/phosphorylase [Desulfurispira natronophila]
MTLTTADLYQCHRNNLGLELLAGGGLTRTLTQPRIQKSGLALAGYLEQVHSNRVQIFGQTEMGYLASLDSTQAKERLQAFTRISYPAVIVANGATVPQWIVEVFTQHQVPLLLTARPSSHVIATITRYLEFELAERTTAHGSMMEVYGVGVLITGESGVGKSECCLDLVSCGHRLIADDLVELKNIAGEIIAFASDTLEHHMEVRGLGIINIKDIFGAASVRLRKKVDVVVELENWDHQRQNKYDRLGDQGEHRFILDMDLPMVRIPVRPGRTIAKIIEVLARNTILKSMGYRTLEDLEEKLHQRIAENALQATDTSVGVTKWR